jgi:hypothetical protein
MDEYAHLKAHFKKKHIYFKNIIIINEIIFLIINNAKGIRCGHKKKT